MNTEIRVGILVVRKGAPQVVGKVIEMFHAYRAPHRLKCRVEWQGAVNGARRWGGGRWNSTTTVLADSLRVAGER